MRASERKRLDNLVRDDESYREQSGRADTGSSPFEERPKPLILRDYSTSGGASGRRLAPALANLPAARQKLPKKTPVSGQGCTPSGNCSGPPRRRRKRDPGPASRRFPGKQNAAHSLPCPAFSAHRGPGRASRRRDRAAGRRAPGLQAFLPGGTRTGAPRIRNSVPPSGCRRIARSSRGPPHLHTSASGGIRCGVRWERGAARPVGFSNGGRRRPIATFYRRPPPFVFR